MTVDSGFAAVVERVAGAVVNISSTRVVRPPSPEQVPYLNVSPQVDRRDIDGRILRRIEERTAVDRELYELAKSR